MQDFYAFLKAFHAFKRAFYALLIVQLGYIYPSFTSDTSLDTNRFQIACQCLIFPLFSFIHSFDSLLWLSYFTYFTACYLQNVSANCEVCQLGEVALW